MTLPPPLAQATIPENVLRVAQRLTERGFRAFLVGGCVRDILRGVAPKDWDVATSALPQDVQRSFDKVIPTGIQHGTVTVLMRGTHVEVTTFRSEGDYLDGRRPSSVEFKSDVADDLSRRDFTINAMAFDPVKKELVDPFGGQADLQAKIIRAVGSALGRFGEDGLRALRAVRFASVLGFTIEPSTLQAIPETLHVFKKVSAERIREEFQKLLLSDRPGEGVLLLERSGLLAAFLPELHDLAQFSWARGRSSALDVAAGALRFTAKVLEVRLATLFAEVARPRTETADRDFPNHDRLGAEMTREALTRLKFPNKVIDKVVLLVREHALPICAGGCLRDGVNGPVEQVQSWSDGQLRRLAARVGSANLDDLFSVIIAQSNDLAETARRQHIDDFRKRLDAVLAQKPALDPKGLALNGGDIMRVLGVGPSPIVGDATRFLMELVFENPELNSRDGLSDALRKWAENRGV